MIITVAQRKGGAGKTTLACQLSVALLKNGFRVATLDADDQGSLTRWAGLRQARLDKPDIYHEKGAGFALPSCIRRARKNADVIVIDTPPTIDKNVTRAISAADLVVAPLQLSPLDLDASLPTAKLIGSLKKKTLFVINRAPPRARVADLIRAKLKESGLPVASTELGNRAAFAQSLASGRGVHETAPSSLATQELTALTAEIAGQLISKRKRAA
ncbi:MAG: ParA family partition ATPase [Pseudomonadota bacterium]